MFVRPRPSSAPGHRHSPTQSHTARGTDIPAVVAAAAQPGGADSAPFAPHPRPRVSHPQRTAPAPSPIQPGLPAALPNHGGCSAPSTGPGTAPVPPDGRDSGQPGPAPPRSPAAGEAPVHLPGPGREQRRAVQRRERRCRMRCSADNPPRHSPRSTGSPGDRPEACGLCGVRRGLSPVPPAAPSRLLRGAVPPVPSPRPRSPRLMPRHKGTDLH